jgi:hypothetical protein
MPAVEHPAREHPARFALAGGSLLADAVAAALADHGEVERVGEADLAAPGQGCAKFAQSSDLSL